MEPPTSSEGQRSQPVNANCVEVAAAAAVATLASGDCWLRGVVVGTD
jgi:hypothetical protein